MAKIKHGEKQRLSLLLLIMLLVVSPLRAESITIGKGSGLVWEGLAFSGTLSGATGTTTLPGGSWSTPLVGVSNLPTSCYVNAPGMYMNGLAAYKIAAGVALIPRVHVSGLFTRYSGDIARFSGNIGYPTQRKVSMDTGTDMNLGGQWCFGPEGATSSPINNYYSETGTRQVDYSGSWVIVTDGSQKDADEIVFSAPTYIISYPYAGTSALSSQNLLPSLTVRISTLSCTIATTAAINFGSVQRNIQSGTELAKLTYPLSTSCTQDAAGGVNANINVQFRAISGNYNATPSWLSLTQGGGYITGEIDNGVTGSGACTGSSGIPFDNTQLKVGNITSAETSKTTSNNVTWRLCSGGSNLPTGTVNASAEMLVTFN